MLEESGGISFPAVYVGVVEYAPASPYTYSCSTHRFPDERTPIEATPLSATSAELVGVWVWFWDWVHTPHTFLYTLPFFSPPSFHSISLYEALYPFFNFPWSTQYPALFACPV